MKNLTPVTGMLCSLLISPVQAASANELTRERVVEINGALIAAMEDKNFAAYDQYLYDGTEVWIDLDPAPDNELKKVPLKDFRMLAMMSLQMADEIIIEDEILSIQVNPEDISLTSKSTVTISMMGEQVIEVSEGTTVYGLINGEIKILSMSSEMIASSMP